MGLVEQLEPDRRRQLGVARTDLGPQGEEPVALGGRVGTQLVVVVDVDDDVEVAFHRRVDQFIDGCEEPRFDVEWRARRRVLRPGDRKTHRVEPGAANHVEMSDLHRKPFVIVDRIERVPDVDATPHPRTVPMAVSERVPVSDRRPDPAPSGGEARPTGSMTGRRARETAPRCSKTTEAAGLGRRLQCRIDRSERTDVLRFLTLASGADIELDRLAFREGLEALTLNVRDVHEHVIAFLTRDEAEAPVSIKEFHCTLHDYQLTSGADRPCGGPYGRGYADGRPVPPRRVRRP